MGIASELRTQWLRMYRQAREDNEAIDAARRQKIIDRLKVIPETNIPDADTPTY